MRTWILISCCLLLTSGLHAEPATEGSSVSPEVPTSSVLPTPFKSTYKVYRNGSEVGTGTRTFYSSSDGRYYFSS